MEGAFDGGTPRPAVGTAGQIAMTSSGQRMTYVPTQPKMDLLFMPTPSKRCGALANDNA